jgi:hypothetical protein
MYIDSVTAPTRQHQSRNTYVCLLRVTKLDEFLDSLLKIAEEDQIFGPLFSMDKDTYICTYKIICTYYFYKRVIGLHFGLFSQKLIWSSWPDWTNFRPFFRYFLENCSLFCGQFITKKVRYLAKYPWAKFWVACQVGPSTINWRRSFGLCVSFGRIRLGPPFISNLDIGTAKIPTYGVKYLCLYQCMYVCPMCSMWKKWTQHQSTFTYSRKCSNRLVTHVWPIM